MNPVLLIGIIIVSGFALGELAGMMRLPRVTGYVLAGILLNPDLTGLVPGDFVTHTDPVTHLALAFIAFSIGGELLYRRIRSRGRAILCVGVMAAEATVVITAGGVIALLPVVFGDAGWIGTYIPLAVILGALASPTDPTATLAVIHENDASGKVTDTVVGVAAFDDALAIVNFSIAVAAARALTMHEGFSLASSIGEPLLSIFGGIAIGAAFGFFFNIVYRLIRGQGEGVMIVPVLGLLGLAYGGARLLGLDELLAPMTMGAVVVNFNEDHEKVMDLIERYTEELIFVLFFALSGMHLKFGALAGSALLTAVFIVLRAAGKVLGGMAGAKIAGEIASVGRLSAGSLLPQGGIVIGLALLVNQDPAFSAFGDSILSIVIGATLVNELLGPVAADYCLRKAGDIRVENNQ